MTSCPLVIARSASDEAIHSSAATFVFAAMGATQHAMHQTPDNRPIYRLLTGKDDRAFCERVSEALEQGWRLHGSPTLAWDTENSCMKAAQAVIWPTD